MYGNYLKLKHFLFVKRGGRKERREHVCEHCQRHGIGHDMHVIEEQRLVSFIFARHLAFAIWHNGYEEHNSHLILQ
ncbi:hypothetical protein ANCDUO_22904 [Ancylostoma duodenale]|uniref:Uncharacterized protein n=1 Tax=Ancylostoma duodenale TaxID=51022 RepID=A0A0C2FEP2_9BILA|nr:hypothetical protein ANCDUO_22904 [Ancylostoma duodenale]